MKLTEKMSYLQGLLDGLDIDADTKEGKALLSMSEVMSELVMYVEDLQSQVDELTELCDILDEDLGSVEEDLYGDDDLSCGDCDDCYDDDDFDEDFEEYEDEFGDDDDDDFGDDDELYEITCPSCGDSILITDVMLEEGSINCPNCNELLEFDFDNMTFEELEGSDEAEEAKEDTEE